MPFGAFGEAASRLSGSAAKFLQVAKTDPNVRGSVGESAENLVSLASLDMARPAPQATRADSSLHALSGRAPSRQQLRAARARAEAMEPQELRDPPEMKRPFKLKLQEMSEGSSALESLVSTTLRWSPGFPERCPCEYRGSDVIQNRAQLCQFVVWPNLPGSLLRWVKDALQGHIARR